ncbi:sensor histidine kinase [Actinocorallia sp. A-T 12471]|uniref:sensor histidine kinase n=1 Tax=Actinocorallia sp. A-T 12471 TaxID=3089813 RepID=UPI0029CD0C5F|nr:ATP-binding protein [Actinocorallia sp. A-T 12471]MDX6744998.1 ATP-binding protein [Actinocorallia sp. A-T 12471]
MNVELAVGLAGLVGLTGGLVTGLAIRWSEIAQGRGEPSQPPPAPLPPGVAQVLNVLPSSAVVLDTDDKVLRASSAARAFGMVSGDRLMVDELLALARRVRRDGEIREAQIQVGVADSRWFAVRVAPLGSGGLVLVLAEDLTEMRRVESIRRDFSANVSHELKTPVGALLLLAETVQDAAEDQEAVRRFAGRMQLEAARLSSLVQDLITLSHVQGEEPLAQEEPVAVDDIVADAVDRATLAAEAREIHFSVAVASDLYVKGDEELLVMALKNLVDNAIAYSPERTKVAITTRVMTQDDRRYAEISVTDQGIGIPERELERIFERFYRVDPARSRQTGGTGLGLAIVKHVATKHGGEVIVWSKEGSGSTFTLRLPLREHPRSLDQSVREDNP